MTYNESNTSTCPDCHCLVADHAQPDHERWHIKQGQMFAKLASDLLRKTGAGF